MVEGAAGLGFARESLTHFRREVGNGDGFDRNLLAVLAAGAEERLRTPVKRFQDLERSDLIHGSGSGARALFPDCDCDRGGTWRIRPAWCRSRRGIERNSSWRGSVRPPSWCF